MRYLLSIDGGGIRGIIPACLLSKLELTTGRATRETFSFIAGTSTGAILSAALAAGLSADRIIDLYVRRGQDIFTPRSPWNRLKQAATGAMYSTQRLHDILCEEFGEAARWILNDSPVDLLITAVGLNGSPWYFVKDKPANARTTGRILLVDCATASAAAPTYFPPWKVTDSVNVNDLVDGGVGVAGNPVYQACVEAFFYTGEYKPEETTVVSLGTGRFPHKAGTPKTLLGWLDWVLWELLRSPGEQQTEITERHFPGTPFYRVDADIAAMDPSLKSPIGMDDVEAIPKLLEYGRKLAELVDWKAILEGTDKTFRVTESNTLPSQYARG